MPAYHQSRPKARKKRPAFTGCYHSITREQLRQLDEQIARENAIRARWCYYCSLAYTPQLENPSFPPALADTIFCADCWERITFEILNLPKPEDLANYWESRW